MTPLVVPVASAWGGTGVGPLPALPLRSGRQGRLRRERRPQPLPARWRPWAGGEPGCWRGAAGAAGEPRGSAQPGRALREAAAAAVLPERTSAPERCARKCEHPWGLRGALWHPRRFCLAVFFQDSSVGVTCALRC